MRWRWGTEEAAHSYSGNNNVMELPLVIELGRGGEGN